MKKTIKYVIVFILSFLATFFKNNELNILLVIPLFSFFMFNGIKYFLTSLLGLLVGSFINIMLTSLYYPFVYLLISMCIFFLLYYILLLFNKRLIINYLLSSLFSILITYLIYLLSYDLFNYYTYLFIAINTLIIVFVFSFLLKNYSFYLNESTDKYTHILLNLLLVIYLSNINNIFDNKIIYYITLITIMFTIIYYCLTHLHVYSFALISSLYLLSFLLNINVINNNIILILLVALTLSINKSKNRFLNAIFVFSSFLINYLINKNIDFIYYFACAIVIFILTLFIKKKSNIDNKDIYYKQYITNKHEIAYQLLNFKELFLSISDNLKQSYINNILNKAKEEVFETLCANCSKVNDCYKKDKHLLLNYLKDCLLDTLTDDKINHIKNNCEKQQAYFTLLDKYTNTYVLNKYKNDENNKSIDIVSANFYSFSKVVDKCINTFNNNRLDVINNFYMNLKNELILYKYDVLFVKNLSTDDDYIFDIAIKNIKIKDINEKIIPIVNKILNSSMVVKNIDTSTLTFSYLIISISSIHKINIDYCMKQSNEDFNACGDSFKVLDSKDQFYIALSDGMGNGIKANEESNFTLNTTFSMLKSKMDVFNSLIISNDLIQIKNNYDSYTTLDLLAINKYSKIASFYKLGAISSFIIRDHQVTQVNNYNLPIGVIDNINPKPTSFILKENDIIVLCSDGLIDDDNYKKVNYILENIAIDDIKVVTNVLFSQLINIRHNIDDATLIVVLIK